MSSLVPLSIYGNQCESEWMSYYAVRGATTSLTSLIDPEDQSSPMFPFLKSGQYGQTFFNARVLLIYSWVCRWGGICLAALLWVSCFSWDHRWWSSWVRSWTRVIGEIVCSHFILVVRIYRKRIRRCLDHVFKTIWCGGGWRGGEVGGGSQTGGKKKKQKTKGDACMFPYSAKSRYVYTSIEFHLYQILLILIFISASFSLLLVLFPSKLPHSFECGFLV